MESLGSFSNLCPGLTPDHDIQALVPVISLQVSINVQSRLGTTTPGKGKWILSNRALMGFSGNKRKGKEIIGTISVCGALFHLVHSSLEVLPLTLFYR